MATLENIRSKGFWLIGAIGIALLCFVIGDFLNNMSSIIHSDQNVVGTVNGESLTREDFEESYKQISEISKLQNRGNNDESYLRASAFETFKQKALIDDAAKNAGLSVTTKELTDATVGNNPHPILVSSGFFSNQQGIFEKNNVQRMIEEIKRDINTVPEDQRSQVAERQAMYRNVWLYMENVIKETLLTDKVTSTLINAMSAPKAEGEYLATLSSKEADAIVAHKLYSDVDDASVQVSDADLLAYYNANKNNYKQEGYRNMQIIMFPIKPSAQDMKDQYTVMDSLRAQLKRTTDEEKLRLLFESASERNYQYINVFITPDNYDRAFTEFAKTATAGTVSDIVTDQNQGLFKCAKALANPVTRPDSVRFSLVVLQEADSVAAKTRADSVANAARKGADFAQLVAQVSKDANSARNGGDQGWITEGLVNLPNFDEKAFTSPVGGVFTINNGPVSFVVKVTDRTKPVLKAKLSILATRMEPSSVTIDSLDQLVNDFLVENKNAEQFVNAAKEKNYMLRPLNNLNRNQPSTYVLQHDRAIIKWAFEHEKGDVSDIFTEVPDNYIIAALTDVVDDVDGYLPFESVKERISSIVLNNKKAEKLIADLNGKALAEIGSIDTVKAVRLSSNYISNVGSEPALAGAITGAKLNELSKPVKCNAGVYVFQKVAERESSLPAVSAKSLNDVVRSSVNSSLMNALEDKAEIVNNCFKFF